MQKYFEKVRENKEIANPAFAQPHMTQNTLLLKGQTVVDGQAIALREFLSQTQDVDICIVKKLIMDECVINDESLSCILEGLILQGKQLNTIIYQNNSFGEKSG